MRTIQTKTKRMYNDFLGFFIERVKIYSIIILVEPTRFELVSFQDSSAHLLL